MTSNASTADNLSVSIIIRALNEAEHLPLLLNGIAAQTVQPDEIILVDSGSTDDSVEICRRRGANIVHIEPADFSFGRALNYGCRAATGDILVFVSAHVYPADDTWLESLVAPFANPEVVLSYGRQTGDSRNAFSEIQLMQQWFPEVRDHDQSTPFCNNANCAVRQTWWQQLPYNEDLTGLEDLDWAKRAQAQGGKVAYEPDALVYHIHEETFARTRRRYQREAIAHRAIFPDQHMSTPEALALFFANVGRDYVAAVPRRQLFRNLVRIPSFRLAQYLGAWEGYRQKGATTSDLKRRFYYPRSFSAIDKRKKTE